MRLFGFVVTCCLLATTAGSQERSVYVTWAGAEPDKGASMWFIMRYVDPQARIVVLPFEAQLVPGIAFDVPQARYRRMHNASTFEALLRDHPTNDPVVLKLAQVIHDIEINLWRPKLYPQSAIIERITRSIAERSPHGDVSLICSLALYDEIYSWLKSGQTELQPDVPPQCAGTQ